MLLLMSFVLGAMVTTWLTPHKKLWATLVTQTSAIFLMSISIMSSTTLFSATSSGLNVDKVSAPLLLLSFWLLPVSLLASTAHLQKKSKKKKQMFITLSLLILTALTVTFSASNLLVFFMGFESTLVPTLFLMSRWGMQQERMEAGYYFVFYTLASSLPLLLSMMTLYNLKGHLKIPLFNFFKPSGSFWLLAVFCLLAFLVKVPVFTLHLWLPKAHVEAPVAGSMILAAMLLKMGGYGFIRLTWIFSQSFQEHLSQMIVPFCCWGGALTSIICLTQTDLKSLMAYSSVSHMSFMMAGMSMLSSWGTSGSMMVMVAHGLVASGLFCVAKIYYERSGSRTLLVSRGLKQVVSLLPLLWLLLACANLGLPPLPKAMGELLTFSSIISHQPLKFLPTAIGVMFTGAFSLMMYQYLKTGTLFKWTTLKVIMTEREMLSLSLHLLPLIALMTTPSLLSL